MLDMSIAAKAKSDQLNAADLIGHDMTVTITKVTLTADNKAVINFDGDNGRPFKPCVTVVRLLNHAWGTNGNDWVGRSMTLFCDPTVMYGGEAVGGVRVSHLSHIDRDIKVVLPVSRNKRQAYHVKKLDVTVAPEKPKFFPQEKFDEQFPKIVESVLQKGEQQKQILINSFTKIAPLTKDQIDAINNIQIPSQDETNEEDVY